MIDSAARPAPAPSSASSALPPVARGPVLSAVVAVAAVLTATSGRYGYHRDELYFRMLEPAWGYVDQPPLVPLLARSLSAAVADEPWALRIPATAATALLVLVLALITRELGGGRGAQALCAWASATASVPLVMGHALLTSAVDLPVWPAVLLFAVRAQLRHDPRWWLAAGLVAGASTYTKLLVPVLLVSLAAGVLLAGPRRLLRSPWVLGGVGVALLVSAPNLAYQATHDWPQLTMGRALVEDTGGEARASMWPFLLLLLGPPLVPVWVAGLHGLARRPGWRSVRFVAASFPVLLAVVFAMGAQPYYPFGLVAVLFAAGCVPVVEWTRRGRAWRSGLLTGAVAVNAAVSAVLALPLLPATVLGRTPVPDINQVAADSVGWPRYVRQVAQVHAALPPEDRSRAVVVATNYGEAGALHRYGPAHGIDRVYSGHNALADQARPPASAGVAVIVGGQADRASELFASCTPAGRLDNGLGVGNEEQGQPIAVCRGPVGGWGAVWPALRHLS